MNPIHRALAALLVLCLGTAAALAQTPQDQFLVPIPEKLERATTTDENGLLQWAEYKAEPCVNCKGKKTMTCQHCLRFDDGDCEDCPECHNTRKATCRICAGTGEMPDILLRAPCPTCFGAGLTRCFICNGRGRFPVAGGGDRLQKCGCCDGKGGYPCTTCKGERWVEPPKLKPSVGDAKSADLKKAQEALEKVGAALASFESVSDGRKDAKAWAKVLAPGQKYFLALKDTQKFFEEMTKDQSKGANWQHYGEATKTTAQSAKQSLEYFVKHQTRLLELCLARAEHNEAAGGGKK